MLSKACLLLLHFHFTSSSHLHTHCQSNLQLNILFTSFTSSVHLSYHTPVSGLGSDTFTVPVLVQCLSFYISKWYDDLVLNHHPSSLNTQHQSIGLLCTPPPHSSNLAKSHFTVFDSSSSWFLSGLDRPSSWFQCKQCSPSKNCSP